MTSEKPASIGTFYLFETFLWLAIVPYGVGGAVLGCVGGILLVSFVWLLSLSDPDWGISCLVVPFGVVWGIIVFGLPLGSLNGFLLATLTRVFFYPLKNEMRYRWAARGVATIASALGTLYIFVWLDPSSLVGYWTYGSALALIVALFGAWASRYPVGWYIQESLRRNVPSTGAANAGHGV